MLKYIYLVTAILVFAAGMALAAPAEVPRTGQITSYGTGSVGDDGALRRGVTWPIPRFNPVSSGTGTVVTDNLTGLMWAGDGGTPTYSVTKTIMFVTTTDTCTGGNMDWIAALDYVACLNFTNYLNYNDWRLPNVNELESLVNLGYNDEICVAPSTFCATNAAWLNSQGFCNVEFGNNGEGWYWSSTLAAQGGVWHVDMDKGAVEIGGVALNVLPVRGGE